MNSDVSKESEVTIRVHEMHSFGRKLRVASVQYRVSAVESQREAKIDSDNSQYTATIVFPEPQPEGAAAATVLAQAQVHAADPKRRPLDNLGPTRDVIKTILDFGTAVAELHPTAKHLSSPAIFWTLFRRDSEG
ncbi:hypothetical protein FS749_009458 [Ceratobasidium sp. UAMH 11750]|nr:hypothetical protein FS749_009458 [Ceratobasidium sp. UAMH 11750]